MLQVATQLVAMRLVCLSETWNNKRWQQGSALEIQLRGGPLALGGV
jgi:hypothetical protein